MNNLKDTVLRGKLLPLPVRKMNAVIQGSVQGLSNSDLPEIKAVTDKTNFKSPEEFVQYVLPYAEKAANDLGVSPLVLVAQAALETGWGKAVTRHPDGSSSFSLFNIKADKRWGGDHVVKSTLEYNNGFAKHEKAAFRSYDSYADSFSDYVDFLRTNSRYVNALDNQGDDALFIKDLHKAGYATDPEYANKILDILNRQSIQDHTSFENTSEVYG